MKEIFASTARHRRSVPALFVICGLGLGLTLLAGISGCRGLGGKDSGKGQKVSFEHEIKPLLAKNCVKCHLGVVRSARGGKAPDFRTRETALAEYAGGQLIVPGSSADSRMFKVVTSTEYGTMPPTGHVLSIQQIALLKRWIDQGAPWPQGPSGTVVPDLR